MNDTALATQANEMSEQDMRLTIEKLGVPFEIARQSYNALAKVVQAVLKEGEDYGTVPGIPTPFLFKNGAQKLCVIFGLRPDPSLQNSVEDWEKGFFHYRYVSKLYYKGEIVSTGTGSCNTREDKFRYVWAESPEPSKQEQEQMKRAKTGKWQKSGKGNDAVWKWVEKQEVSNPYNNVHNCEQRAKKRSIVDSVNQAFGAAAFFQGQYEDYLEDDQEEQEPITIQGRTVQPAQDAGFKQQQDEFWAAVDAKGIPRNDKRANELAKKAALGSITWAAAADALSQPQTAKP